ncbi:uncharacterized protein MONBRDRAFT_25718 [Monosiga brevicollis MX1]|uniref:Inward rectifier potassium channel C-terminal domain-containing protein n=1 Tax=Monosiga brevicollis TaxID=81824 RepID=A9V082_MONBE|nr:uncharacterized protein MONBRDRAFT_25718 [Monosiga brevicollis MX1]EDQ89111.1 predicted protein [Monosiga brevicollis MX1]|eukprot:XP_001746216.1 hypothetical protein [Monosiga brevicollis MX1]
MPSATLRPPGHRPRAVQPEPDVNARRQAQQNQEQGPSRDHEEPLLHDREQSVPDEHNGSASSSTRRVKEEELQSMWKSFMVEPSPRSLWDILFRPKPVEIYDRLDRVLSNDAIIEPVSRLTQCVPPILAPSSPASCTIALSRSLSIHLHRRCRLAPPSPLYATRLRTWVWRWQRNPAAILLVFVMATFAIAGLSTGLFAAAECNVDTTASRTFFLLLLQACSLHPAISAVNNAEAAHQSDLCLFLGTLSSLGSFVALVLFVIYLYRWICQPLNGIRFSRVVTTVTRDGRPNMQFRIVNKFGHLLTDVTVRATYCHPVTTAEDERHWQIDDVKFEGPMVLKFPGTYTHYMDIQSPLFPNWARQLPHQGLLFINVRAYDPRRHEETCAVKAYQLPESCAPNQRFDGIVLRSFEEAINETNYRIANNLANFNKWSPNALSKAIEDTILRSQEMDREFADQINMRCYQQLRDAVDEINRQFDPDADNRNDASNLSQPTGLDLPRPASRNDIGTTDPTRLRTLSLHEC